MPGVIKGNPLDGLCERVCIEVDKVFDACLRQTQAEVTLTLTGENPPSPALPLTFISGRSTAVFGTVSNLIITPVSERPRQARVQMDITVPMEITYRDANGAEGTGTASAVFHDDVIMCVPEATVIPFEARAVTSILVTSATFTAPATFNAVCCLTFIIKIIIHAELLIPSYGYCELPPCVPYGATECENFFRLPIFPR